MFNLQKYGDRCAVITDRNESLSYLQLQQEVNKFYGHISTSGFLFCLCENVLASFVGYVACMNKRVPAVLLDGSKDLQLVLRLIDIYHPEYIWMPTRRVKEIGGATVYEFSGYSLQQMAYADDLVVKDIHPDLALCLTTSGSTGSPKLVRLSERNLQSNAES